MQHGGENAIGGLVPGDIDDRDSCHSTAAFEVGHNLRPAGFRRLFDPRIQIVARLEIDIDDVVAAHPTVEGHRRTVDVDALEHRNLARQRNDILEDILEIPEFVC